MSGNKYLKIRTPGYLLIVKFSFAFQNTLEDSNFLSSPATNWLKRKEKKKKKSLASELLLWSRWFYSLLSSPVTELQCGFVCEVFLFHSLDNNTSCLSLLIAICFTLVRLLAYLKHNCHHFKGKVLIRHDKYSWLDVATTGIATWGMMREIITKINY